ncbi:hypothetical protein HA402_005245 [Bradysia odoriphaga]|nr:hypothetical protein HA402_005245 [Bradysia odoriphaga]
MVSNKPLPNFIAFGNSLVDQSVKVPNHDILKRYNLNPNELGECSPEILSNIIRDVRHENLEVQVHLGGSALNTCRLLRAIDVCYDARQTARILFCGAIGVDDNGQFVERQLKELDIETFLQTDPTESTGTCICLIHKEDRCCYANIGASKHFQANDKLTDKLKAIVNIQERAVVYIEGFFLTERSQVCRSIIQQFSERNSNVTLAVNLSAPYLVENNIADVNFLVEQADIVFGNKDEFEVLAKCNQINTVIEFVYSMSESLNANARNKIIVITDGNQPIEIYTLVMNESFKWETLDVRVVKQQDVIDTTGAGDAFVAGFFHAYLRQDAIKDCVKFGMEVAVNKLKNVGAQL